MTLREWAQKWHVMITYEPPFSTCYVPGESHYPHEAFRELHHLDDWFVTNFFDDKMILTPVTRAHWQWVFGESLDEYLRREIPDAAKTRQ